MPEPYAGDWRSPQHETDYLSVEAANAGAHSLGLAGWSVISARQGPSTSGERRCTARTGSCAEAGT